MILEEGERLEDLQFDNLKIVQNKQLYTFTSDSVILANYISTKVSDIAVEIGAGSGVISILVQAKNDIKKIFAFEIQEKMQKLCKKNIKLNNLEDKIELICDDIKNFSCYFKKESVDVVYSNPPYYKQTNFVQNEVKKIAKEEICLSAKEMVVCVSQLLRKGGTFFCCYSAERSAELICLCQNNNLAVKEMFFTENGKGETKLIFLKAVKGGKNGVKVLPNLTTNDSDGNYLQILQTKHLKNKKG